MKFKIETVNIITQKRFDAEDTTVGEAIYTNYEGELDIHMTWNDFIIKLSMKWDISDLWNDIKKMIHDIENKSNHTFSISWPSSSFMAIWEVKKKGKLLCLEAFWTSIAGGQDTLEQLKNVDNKIEIDKDIFLREWYKLLISIKNDLEQAGYSNNSLEDFYFLENLVIKYNSELN